ncbi:MAG: carboxypeptidase regulatory-like domain-containing protein, partial [Candidatus Verstraetearchaeota archaeon]|nr:carboxypeptidase regulatory-like domain-containing protein [Candidatus Verstraetearchaeota archaeon]
MKKIIPFFFLFFLFIVPIVAQTLTVTTDKNVYSPGETIIVSGNAVPNTDVTVKLLNPNGELVDINFVTSSATGTYSITFKTPAQMPTGKWILGTYTVEAYMAGQTASKTITIQQLIAVKGKVVDAKGLPISDAKVTIGTVSTTTGTDGSFIISLPAEGTYTITITKVGYYKYEGNVTAKIGTTDIGTITLESLEDAIAALESRVSALENQVNSLNNQISLLTKQISALNSSLADANAKIATLTTQLQ